MTSSIANSYVEHADARSVSTRQRWETIARNQDLGQFIYVASNDLEQKGISTHSLTLEHWNKMRRWLPLIETPLDDEERYALQISADAILAMMVELGKWALIIWLLRGLKRKHSKDEESSIEVTGGITGNGIVVSDGKSEVKVIKVTSSPKFNFYVFIGSPPTEGEARPILVLGQPDKLVQFLPISADYLPYNEDIVKQAIEKLSSPNPDERASAIGIIRERGSEQDIAAILPLLNDCEKRVKQLAADTIGEHSYKGALPMLKEILKGLSSIDILGETIALALVEIGDKSVIPVLASLYTKVTNAERLRLPLAAACLSQDENFDALIEAVRSGDKATRMGAIALLADIFQKPSPPQLSEVWSH